MLLGLVDQRLNLLLCKPVEQLLRVGQLGLASAGLDMENRHVEIVDIPPRLIGRGHDIQLGVGEGLAFVQLDDSVFGGVA